MTGKTVARQTEMMRVGQSIQHARRSVSERAVDAPGDNRQVGLAGQA